MDPISRLAAKIQDDKSALSRWMTLNPFKIHPLFQKIAKSPGQTLVNTQELGTVNKELFEEINLKRLAKNLE